jgi:hypothetical protein
MTVSPLTAGMQKEERCKVQLPRIAAPIRSETQILKWLGYNTLDMPLLHVSGISKSRLKSGFRFRLYFSIN